MGFIMFLIIGGIAGWLAGQLMKGRGFGLFGNIGIGIVGAFLGGFLFNLLGAIRNRSNWFNRYRKQRARCSCCLLYVSLNKAKLANLFSPYLPRPILLSYRG